jgi:N-acetylmuramoyl-L-alanine amidase
VSLSPNRLERTARYNQTLYGYPSYRLQQVRTIVEHWTDGDTFDQAYSYWQSDEDGPYAHFVIDQGGLVYRTAPLWLTARHVYGLDALSIGIEHVGRSDGEVLGRPAELQASLRLTCTLLRAYGLAPSAVIGHAEALGSPFYSVRVRVPPPHSDMGSDAMTRYRQLLSTSCTRVRSASRRRKPSRTALVSGSWRSR